MIASKTEIANLARSMIGVQAITAIDGQSASETSARLIVENAIGTVISTYKWASIRKRISLTQTTNDTTEYLYKYNLPVYVGGIVKVITDTRWTREGGAIYADSETLELIYTLSSDYLKLRELSDYIIDLMAIKAAAVFALAILKDKDMNATYEAIFRSKFKEYKRYDIQANSKTDEEVEAWDERVEGS